jgi:hypothetical protein
MNQPFEIKFDFPLANSDMNVTLKAKAELHHSDPYYVIDEFRFARSRKKSEPSVLPRQEIIVVEDEGVRKWVHKDSKRPSLLSMSMGRAIDAISPGEISRKDAE